MKLSPGLQGWSFLRLTLAPSVVTNSFSVTRRNEIILTTRPVHLASKPQTTSRPHRPSTSHPPSHSHTRTTHTSNTAASTGRSVPSSLLGESLNSQGRKQQKIVSAKPRPPSKTTPTQSKAVARYSGGSSVVPAGRQSKSGSVGEKGRRSRKGRSSILNQTLTRLLALEGVVVTRDDLLMKATSVLQTLLPETWRNHKCR